MKKIDSTTSGKFFPKLVGGLLIFFGFLVLVGWVFDIQAFKSILPTFISMKVNTAIGFILLGAAIWLNENKFKILSSLCAVVVFLLGALTLGEYLFGWQLGIDELFFKDADVILTFFPGRMAITSSINSILLGIGLLLLIYNWKKISDAASLTVLTVSVFSFIGYLSDVKEFFHFGATQITPMAFHTCILFIIASLGMLYSNIEKGALNVFVYKGVGSILLHRIFPLSIILTLFTGWIIDLGTMRYFNLYGHNFFAALQMMVTIIISTVLLFYSATIIKKESEKRLAAEAETARLVASHEKELLAEKLTMKKNEKELKDANEQLAKVNSILVGRELKMIELKKEISALKK